VGLGAARAVEEEKGRAPHRQPPRPRRAAL